MLNKYALQIITLIFLAIATFIDGDDLPYGFYTILRFVVCGYFGYKAHLNYKEHKNTSFLFCFLVLFAITYNPFVKVKLDNDEWLLINILTAVFIIYTEFLSLRILKKCGIYLLKIIKILAIPAVIIWITISAYNNKLQEQEKIELAKAIKEKQEQLFTDLGIYTAIFEYIPERCKKAGYEQNIINNVKRDYQPEISVLFNRARNTYISKDKNILTTYYELPQEKMEEAAQKGWNQARTTAVIKKILEIHKDNPQEFENIMMDILMTGNIDEFTAKYQENPQDESIMADLLKTVDISKYYNLITEKDVCVTIEDTFKDDYRMFVGFLEKYNINHQQHNPTLLRSAPNWIIEQSHN